MYVAAAMFVVYIAYNLVSGQTAIVEGARNRKDDSDSDGDAITKIIDKMDAKSKSMNTSIDQMGSKSDLEDLLAAFQDNITTSITLATVLMAQSMSDGKPIVQEVQNIANMHKMLKDVIPTALDHIGNKGSAASKVTSGLF